MSFAFKKMLHRGVPSGSVTYDATIGLGVDSIGYADLTRRAGANVYFVGNGGSDAATGATHALRLASITEAVTNRVTAGQGDHVLIAEGSTFPEFIPWLAFKGGFSAAYPTVIQSYDPTDPLNAAKYGRAYQRDLRPILTAKQQLASGGAFSYIAIRGLDFNPGNVDGSGLELRGQGSYLLFEGNKFQYTGVSLDTADSIISAQHAIIRNNSFHGMWSTGGRTGGLYCAGYDGPTVEDNVFYHCGWKEGISRVYTGNEDESSAEYNAWMATGGPTVFSHSYYIQTNTTNAVVRRNLSVAGSGDGGIARGDSVFTENLFINNPLAIGLGGGPTYNVDAGSSDGVSFDCSYNGIIGDDDVRTTGHQIGWGINTTNGVSGSRVHHNVMVRSRNPSGPNVSGFSNSAAFAQPSYADYDNNVMWNWVASTGQVHFDQSDALASWVHTTYTNNNWDGAASGSNTNSASTVFPNAYTTTSLVVAEGYADLDAFIQQAINFPEQHIQRSARARLFAGYGR